MPKKRRPESTPAEAMERLHEVQLQLQALIHEQGYLLSLIDRVDAMVLATKDESFDRVIAARLADQESPRIRVEDVLNLARVSKRTLYRWLADDQMDFPSPKIVRGVSLWERDQVVEWVARNAENFGRWPAKEAHA